MKFRGVILLLGSMWFVAVLLAQTSSDELPSAPSAIKQERGAGVEYGGDGRITSRSSGRFACCQA